MAGRYFLRFLGIGSDTGGNHFIPGGIEVVNFLPERGLTFISETGPPRIGAVCCVITPALAYFSVVLGVVKSFKHVLWHNGPSFLNGRYGGFHRADLDINTLFFSKEACAVSFQRRGITGVAVEYLSDGSKRESKFPE